MSDDMPHDGPAGHDHTADIPDFIRQKPPSGDHFGSEDVGSPTPQNVPLALGLGTLAALLGGALWAMVVTVFNIELGLIAWGIGLLVGLAIITVAKHGDMRLGGSAAGIALFGLVVGKVLIAQFGLAYSSADAIIEDPQLLSEAIYHNMVQHDEVSPEVVDFYKNSPEEGRPSPGLNRDLMNIEATIASRAENMSEEDKRAVAESYAEDTLSDISFGERLGLSGWDLVWLGLAVYTAFRICSVGRRREGAEPA